MRSVATELYWFAVFGEPGSPAPWSWRIGGHHVAIHVTIADDRVVGTTPSFLRSEPGGRTAGAANGRQDPAGEEEAGARPAGGVDPTERGVAVVDSTAPADILTGTGRLADLRFVPVGVRHADLGADGKTALERLIRHYVDRVRPEVAGAAWERITGAGLGDVAVRMVGTGRSGPRPLLRGPWADIRHRVRQHPERRQARRHAVWRDVANDWGEDLLAEHLAASHGRGR